MLKKNVSLVEFSTTPTVSVMMGKTGINVAGSKQQEEATQRVNAALEQHNAQARAAGQQPAQDTGAGAGIFGEMEE
jgi:hypothetical protein